MTITLALRASLLHYTDDPAFKEDGIHWHADGLLLLDDEKIVAAGDYTALKHLLPDDVVVKHYPGKIIMPGFIDTHIHYPQTDMIASPAPGLLPWLEQYTFPTERQFQNPAHANDVASFFLDELLRCGTTTAMVYCTVHPESVDAFFTQSEKRHLRMVAGKVMMDRHCPEFLQDTAESSARDTEALIQRWHNHGRQLYAITPRFAPTSTPEQLHLAGELAKQYPDTFIQTHVAENKDECSWARSLFPNARSYLDIYDQVGLMRPRAMYAHCIWLDDEDRRRMAETQSVQAERALAAEQNLQPQLRPGPASQLQPMQAFGQRLVQLANGPSVGRQPQPAPKQRVGIGGQLLQSNSISAWARVLACTSSNRTGANDLRCTAHGPSSLSRARCCGVG